MLRRANANISPTGIRDGQSPFTPLLRATCLRFARARVYLLSLPRFLFAPRARCYVPVQLHFDTPSRAFIPLLTSHFRIVHCGLQATPVGNRDGRNTRKTRFSRFFSSSLLIHSRAR